MDLALYDGEGGYYARAPQRSGRAGDFFTSVDVGSVFGELLERQIAEMAAILAEAQKPRAGTGAGATGDVSGAFDLVEAGAGNGRLAADILRAAAAASGGGERGGANRAARDARRGRRPSSIVIRRAARPF